jgi:hypothetical protein
MLLRVSSAGQRPAYPGRAGGELGVVEQGVEAVRSSADPARLEGPHYLPLPTLTCENSSSRESDSGVTVTLPAAGVRPRVPNTYPNRRSDRRRTHIAAGQRHGGFDLPPALLKRVPQVRILPGARIRSAPHQRKHGEGLILFCPAVGGRRRRFAGVCTQYVPTFGAGPPGQGRSPRPKRPPRCARAGMQPGSAATPGVSRWSALPPSGRSRGRPRGTSAER